jgi:hypothetical protein
MAELVEHTWSLTVPDEEGTRRLAELLALDVRTCDLVTLKGDLGAGKSTFARALIRALIGDDAADVPSPTFSLVQGYDTPRVHVSHFDLYRLSGPEGLTEIGFDEAVLTGMALVEWPERAADALPPVRLNITITETPDPNARSVTLMGRGPFSARVQRLQQKWQFLAENGWGAARIAYLQGDASQRRYARLDRAGARAILMDAPRQPDGPIVRDGKPYSRIAHLAENVRPFIAIDLALRRSGFSAPEIFASDAELGLLLLEDLGDRVFGREVAAGGDQSRLWRAAVDALIAMRALPRDRRLPLPDGSVHELPRFDRSALEIEIGLLLDWYWPMLNGADAPPRIRESFAAAWAPHLDRLMSLEPGWFLRDVHSPNLIWLPERHGIARVGLIDFQDALAEHFAFDLASLLQDARLDVPAALEDELLAYYCQTVGAREADFDPRAFIIAYRTFGAQRTTRLVGLWVRLLRRDGKPHYLQHMPRTWRYLERNLAHPDLADLKSWYDANIPIEQRRRTISQ